MKRYSLIFAALLSINSFGAELEVGKGYRINSDFTIYQITNAAANPLVKKDFTAGKYSRFEVVGKLTNGYEIQFEKLYGIPVVDSFGVPVLDTKGQLQYKTTGLSESIVYVVNTNIKDGGKIEDRTTPAHNGLASGPLIVPFKYRLNDKSLEGEATLGYYFGYTYDLTWLELKRVSWTPFLSGGVTQVGVASIDENGEISETNKTGISWAGGFFLNNWDKVNIGFVFGQDRTGDKQWEHEGRTWISFSVGWEL